MHVRGDRLLRGMRGEVTDVEFLHDLILSKQRWPAAEIDRYIENIRVLWLETR